MNNISVKIKISTKFITIDIIYIYMNVERCLKLNIKWKKLKFVLIAFAHTKIKN